MWGWGKFIIFAGCLFLLAACSVQQEKAPTLKPAELSDSERQLLQAGGADYSDVYELEMKDGTAEMLEITVEHYEKGEKAEDITSLRSHFPKGEEVDSKSHRLVFAAANFGEFIQEASGEWEQKDMYQRFVLTHLNGGGSTSVNRLIRDDDSTVSAGVGSGATMNLDMDKPVRLAAIIKNTDSEFSVPAGLLEDEEEAFLQKIADFEHVYVFTVMLFSP